ncbi:nitrilase-related carbon-nitrogen hydrolase [Streptomyces sp. NPDC056508]|uniref:nitrilase-related carbon-nitrogen hydrolase n=1 Tax=Streptomyces sp. NPDC056508 TaxID=3345845 RepID=UPI003691DBB3
MTPAATPLHILAGGLQPTPPEVGQGLRVALYQGEGPAGSREAVEANMERLDEAVALASDHGAQVCVFPECYPTGYALGSSLIRELAQHQDGPILARAARSAREHATAVVLPYIERDGEKIYDSITVIAPGGTPLTNYRKTHLYGAAEQSNFSPGTKLPPLIELNGIGVGLLNCYECEFPPLYQYLAERGARVVIGPTAAEHHYRMPNGRLSAIPYPDDTVHIIPAMASIWRLFIAYANRRGWEHPDPGPSRFYRANSGIWAPDGNALVTATPAEQNHDCLIIADCLPGTATPFSPEGDHLRDNRLSLNSGLRIADDRETPYDAETCEGNFVPPGNPGTAPAVPPQPNTLRRRS